MADKPTALERHQSRCGVEFCILHAASPDLLAALESAPEPPNPQKGLEWPTYKAWYDGQRTAALNIKTHNPAHDNVADPLDALEAAPKPPCSYTKGDEAKWLAYAADCKRWYDGPRAAALAKVKA